MIKHIDANKCTGCGICVEICPMDVLRMHTKNGEKHRFPATSVFSRKSTCDSKSYIAYPEDCMTCFNCEIQCPEQAIEVDFDRLVLPAINVLAEK